MGNESVEGDHLVVGEDREHKFLLLNFLRPEVLLKSESLLDAKLLEKIGDTCLKVGSVLLVVFSESAHVLIMSDSCEEFLDIV